MSTTIPAQRVRERTTTTLLIPLTDAAGDDLDAGGLTTLTASMTSLDTGEAIASMQARDVKASLVAGVLALELTPDDLDMVTTRALEQRVITLSASYDGDKEWHEEIPLEVVNLHAVG